MERRRKGGKGVCADRPPKERAREARQLGREIRAGGEVEDEGRGRKRGKMVRGRERAGRGGGKTVGADDGAKRGSGKAAGAEEQAGREDGMACGSGRAGEREGVPRLQS